jgi:putative transport protein
MAWFLNVLHVHPEVAFFLTLGIGYLVGRIRIGSFALGAVTGTLLAGVVIGQLGIRISPDVKQCFFLLFLFSIGYRCGPQFFQGLKSDGLSQAAVAFVVATTGLIVAYLCSRFFGYDAGTAAGVIAGSLTESATIGTAGDAISHLAVPAATRTMLANQIPVAFAVTYLVGVVGAAWFLAAAAPRIMGIDLAEVCREYEIKLGRGKGHRADGVVSAYRYIELRAYYIAENSPLAGKHISDVFPGLRIFLERVRRGGELIDAGPDMILVPGDIAAISSRRRLLVENVLAVAPEVEDPELLDVAAESLDVFVTNKGVAGRTIRELGEAPRASGIYLRRITRHKADVPILPETVIQRGDILTLVGSQRHVADAVKLIGVSDAVSDTTDMVFVSTGIVAGALVGIPAFEIGKLEIGLSLSVGVLLGGLVWGWLNSVRPMVGRIPTPTLWIFESLGLTGFIAIVGLAAGPDFVAGLRSSGVSLLFAGLLTVILSHLAGVLFGRHVFKMHPGVLLGVCAGAGTATPALAAIQEAAKSSVPTLGYGVGYAVGNVLLALWGALIVGLTG